MTIIRAYSLISFMKLIFSYELERDVENFIHSSHSVNSDKKTSFQMLYSKEFGENLAPDQVREFILKYLRNYSIDIAREIERIEIGWKSIEADFLTRAEAMFGYEYTKNITVYLTTNNRCTYNIEKSYFFVYLGSTFPNAIIMHELFHFYTWFAFHDYLKQKDISPKDYNDLKESLTELLNIELSDLMNGAIDYGYSQHLELRTQIKALWAKSKNLKSVIDEFKLPLSQVVPNE